MTSTITLTETITLTAARHISSKIAADLQLLHTHYGKPSDEEITNYSKEIEILLSKNYLSSVEYGFKRNEEVVFSLKYVANSDGTLKTDNMPGKIPYDLNLTGATLYSYLRQSSTFFQLSPSEQSAIKDMLPIKRNPASEPALSSDGYWESTLTYSKDGASVQRKVFKPRG